MPALPDVPQVIRIDLQHSEDADPLLDNRTFWRYTGGAPADADLDSLASSLAGGWASILAPLAPTSVKLDGIVCTDLTSPTSARGSWTGSHFGTRSGTRPFINTCALLNFQIGRRYRGGKPRTYNPWGTDTDLATSQEWATEFVTEVNTDWTTWASEITGSSAGPATLGAQCNVSYYHGFASVQNPVTLRWRNIPTPRSTAVTDNITGHSCNQLVASQRRRVRA